MKKIFYELDENGNGVVSLEEMENGMEMFSQKAGLNFSKEDGQ